MLLQIEHRTEYVYDRPPSYGLMRLRLTPRNDPTQRVREWRVEVQGATPQVTYRDQFGNDARLISLDGDGHHITITARGQVETRDSAGVLGPHRRLAPMWLFLKPTRLTMPGDGIRALIDTLPKGGTSLDTAHALMSTVAEQVAYVINTTDPTTTAEQALANGSGVCQDHSHIFVSAARLLGLPARYVSGYLRMDDRTEQVATHAWAETFHEGLGWVGFDASNHISPDERYVRVAVGRDYEDAAPVSGMRYGVAQEHLDVRLSVVDQ